MSVAGMSLASLLPAPSQSRWDRDEERVRQAEQRENQVVSAAKAAPPYGKRKGWIPRTVEDFGDGGAFPEIHVAQYPLKNVILLYIRVSVDLSWHYSRKESQELDITLDSTAL